MTPTEKKALLATLRARFDAYPGRHEGVAWSEVERRVAARSRALAALAAMEATGGEPDVIGRDAGTGAIVFCDCSAESPAGRRSLCYDAEALAARKEHRPKHSAVARAAELGVELLTEEAYRELQRLGEFDRKTSSWVHTPADVRALGGALFCDRRFGRVFVYHNGAESYYAARGFRGALRV
ncbi:MAG: DUF4256 domain-containing protein [Polyangiaceae bacterium]|nr:DUF4256 domain-containing protein [Polyangiaceae bacterium]